MFKKIDCIEIHVTDLDQALEFYRDKLGHSLAWRTQEDAGLSLPESGGEIVLQTLRPGLAVDFEVSNADQAALEFERAGGKVVVAPFDIRIGRCAVVEDPWGNRLVLLDMSKGRLTTDEAGNVTGVSL